MLTLAEPHLILGAFSLLSQPTLNLYRLLAPDQLCASAGDGFPPMGANLMGHQAALKAEAQRQGGAWKSCSLLVPGCALRHLQDTTVVPGSYKASSASSFSRVQSWFHPAQLWAVGQ